MIDIKRIFPECSSDTLLVELILERGYPSHSYGISKVATELKNFNNNSEFIVGLVDNDKFKNVPPYLQKFEEKENKQVNEGLILKQLAESQKYLIVVCPAFEKWIWQRALESNISTKEFGYKTWDDLLNASKNNQVRADANFKKFVNAVVRSDNVAVQTLRSWLLNAM